MKCTRQHSCTNCEYSRIKLTEDKESNYLTKVYCSRFDVSSHTVRELKQAVNASNNVQVKR